MAALRLPSEIQRLLAELFVKVPPSDIRVSTARAVKDWGPDLPTGGKSDGGWWKQAGILYLGGQVRGGFYTRRTHPEGNEFLALRWDKVHRYRQTPLAR